MRKGVELLHQDAAGSYPLLDVERLLDQPDNEGADRGFVLFFARLAAMSASDLGD